MKTSERLLEVDDVNKMKSCYTLRPISLDWMRRKLFQSWMFPLIHSCLENRTQSWSILFSILFSFHDIERWGLDLCFFCHMHGLLSGSVLLFVIAVLFRSILIREAEVAILTYFGRRKCIQCFPSGLLPILCHINTRCFYSVFSSSGCHSKIYFSPFWRVTTKGGGGTSVARLWWGLSC